MRPLACLALLSACDADPSPDDEASPGERCALTPAYDGEVSGLRVGPDGAVYLSDLGGTLFRYERTDAGDDCTLEGAAIWEPGSLQDVTDFELDAQGRVYALVFYDALVRLSPEGAVELECEVEAGHAVAVTPDGTKAAVVGVGAETLAWTEMGEAACAAPGAAIALPHAIGTSPAATADALVVDAHDPGGTLPPGFVLDAADGSVRLELGAGSDAETGEEIAAIADLVVTPTGYWVAGAPDGDLWRLDDEGRVEAHYRAEALLPVPEDPDAPLYVQAIGWSASGPSYVAAGFIDVQGVWTLEL